MVYGRCNVAMNKKSSSCEGGCSCGQVRYEISSDPLIVHCCHCSYCQRQTGTAFALNALFEADKVTFIQGEVEEINTNSPSGKGQIIARCPQCKTAVWSNYNMGGIKKGIRFIRVGTLDNPEQLPPDVHIYTVSKQPWVNLSNEERIYEKFYHYNEVWSEENNQKRKQLLAKSLED